MVPRARIALLGAVAGGIGLLAVWLAAFHVARLAALDQRVLEGFVELRTRPHVSGLAARIASICDPKPYAVCALLIVGLALLRGRLRLGLAAAGSLVAAPATTELLKPWLAAPRPSDTLLLAQHPLPPGSWPSGHATAAMALGLGLTLVMPARWRPWAAAAGAGFAAAVCFSFLTLEWHYPSDVLGGFLIAFVWASRAVAAVAWSERSVARGDVAPAAEPSGSLLAPPLAALGGALLISVAVLLARPVPVKAYAAAHHSFLLGAGVIAVLALVLPVSLSLLARRE